MVILYTSDKGNFISLKNITIDEMESRGIKKNIYVNLTNRCPCACTFCLRTTKKWLKLIAYGFKRNQQLKK